MQPTASVRTVNGIDLHVRRFRDETASPTGLTLLFLHGFLDAGGTWDRVAEPLARAGHDVVVPDLRGFGQSGWIGAGGYYHFPDYVADVAELVEHLAPARLAVVGHSMGGSIAGLYTGAFPERVERLALLEGLGPPSLDPALAVDRMQTWLRDLRSVRRAPRPLASLDDAVARLAAHHPRVPRDLLTTIAPHLTRCDEAGRVVWAHDPLHRTTAPALFQIAQYRSFLRRIPCPTLIVGGGPTGWHVPDEDDRVACLRHAERFDLPDAGHMMHWTAPAPLADRLIAFFSPAPPRPAP